MFILTIILLLILIINKLNIDVDVRAVAEGKHVLEAILMNYCCLVLDWSRRGFWLMIMIHRFESERISEIDSFC